MRVCVAMLIADVARTELIVSTERTPETSSYRNHQGTVPRYGSCAVWDS